MCEKGVNLYNDTENSIYKIKYNIHIDIDIVCDE